MSVYIKGMEMPKYCGECRFCVDGWCYVIPEFERQPGEINKAEKTRWCPLIPVSDHGDLIDREPLRASIKESIDECYKWAKKVNEGEMYARVSQSLGTFVECSLRIKAAPTIIPADKDGAE